MIELEIKGGIIPTDKPVSVEDIIELSKCQHATCMYSEKELRGFSQEKLNVIFQGIQALSGRGPWRRTRSLREFLGKGSIKKCKKESKGSLKCNSVMP